MALCAVLQMKEQMKESLAVQVKGAKGPFQSTFHTGYQVCWILFGDDKIGWMGCQNIPTGVLTECALAGHRMKETGTNISCRIGGPNTGISGLLARHSPIRTASSVVVQVGTCLLPPLA